MIDLKIIKEGQEAAEELETMLSKVRVEAKEATTPGITEAIIQIFGENYIGLHAPTYITYDMYTKAMTLLRELGNETVKEYI